METMTAIHPIDILVGQNLRALRLQRGISQSALAEKVGITFQQIQKYEKGTNRVSASMMHDIAQALDVEIPLFFRGNAAAGDRAIADHPSADLTGNRLDLQIMEKVSGIRDVTIKRRLLALIDALLMTSDDQGGWARKPASEAPPIVPDSV